MHLLPTLRVPATSTAVLRRLHQRCPNRYSAAFFRSTPPPAPPPQWRPHWHLPRSPSHARFSTYAPRRRARNTKPDPENASAEVHGGRFEEKRSARSPMSKSSLRRMAASSHRGESTGTKLCTAYCTAEKYNLREVAAILREKNYTLDPFDTGLANQVLHLRLQYSEGQGGQSDVFIFPSGNIVSWDLPSSQISRLAGLILPAAETPFEEVETEDLEYVQDPRVRRSRIGGDVIVLGTAPHDVNHVVTDSATHTVDSPPRAAAEPNVLLAKIAFSSGLARSTKLAVLESRLNNYLETISTIPTLLSRGSQLPFSRSYILCKTGELLQFRAQLNLYSELTDSLPDIFWDSRHELGLEGYYESVGRALDVDVRIRQLNDKLDYASGIVQVLRERLSEKHSLGLEWMIILLITVEVGFELVRLWKEERPDEREARKYQRWRERKEMEEDAEYQAWRRSSDVSSA